MLICSLSGEQLARQMDRYVKGYRDISPEGNMYVWIVYLDRRT
jgi:hypothetical protein